MVPCRPHASEPTNCTYSTAHLERLSITLSPRALDWMSLVQFHSRPYMCMTLNLYCTFTFTALGNVHIYLTVCSTVEEWKCEDSDKTFEITLVSIWTWKIKSEPLSSSSSVKVSLLLLSLVSCIFKLHVQTACKSCKTKRPALTSNGIVLAQNIQDVIWTTSNTLDTFRWITNTVLR